MLWRRWHACASGPRLSHDHVWPNLTALATGDLGQLVAVAEPDARFRARLERPDLDAVLVFADNRTSVRLGLQALACGLPVMIEKPIAADLRGAEALIAESRAARLPLMLNWRTAWRPAVPLLPAVADEAADLVQPGGIPRLGDELGAGEHGVGLDVPEHRGFGIGSPEGRRDTTEARSNRKPSTCIVCTQYCRLSMIHDRSAAVAGPIRPSIRFRQDSV